MVPTLAGRIQTRIVLLLFVGGAVTALLGLVLPLPVPLADRYRTTFIVLATVLVLGLAWEFSYHLLMQWRWEKDWPTLFGLLTMINEGVLVYLFLRAGWVPGLSGPVHTSAFVIHFVVVWLTVWMVANGPLRVPFIRWRFRGGRFV